MLLSTGCERDLPTIASKRQARNNLCSVIQSRPGLPCRLSQHSIESLAIEMPALPIGIEDKVSLVQLLFAPDRKNAGRRQMPGCKESLPLRGRCSSG